MNKMKDDNTQDPGRQWVAARDGCRHFMEELLAALGWSNPRAVNVKTEADVLCEVRRLRRSAGEIEDDRLLLDIETLPVARVHRVGGRSLRYASLWVSTWAGIVETSTQQDGGPVGQAAVEQPERSIHLVFEEGEAREAYALLGEAIERWDAARE